MIKAIIDNLEVEVEKGITILNAARKVNIEIPTLCHHPDLPSTASCGVCVVKVAGRPNMIRACCTPLEEGMNVTTFDPEIIAVRRTVIELILSDHPDECLTCIRSGRCELQDLADEFGIREAAFDNLVAHLPCDDSTKTIVINPDKCISCGRCIEVCQGTQNVWALSFLNRGLPTRIAPAGDIDLADSPCIRCGQCSAHCPTGAITEYDETEKVWNLLMDKDKHCIVQIAPAVRVAIGEDFGYEPGTNLTGKTYTALKRLGFDTVFDTNYGADVTIMEEGSEFVDRFTNDGVLPLITSCCPSWTDFMEKFHSDMIPNFSSCKSPHAIVGALTKTYYAEKMGIDPSKIVMVSIMPCTSKKYEIIRSKEMYSSGFQDVDVTLTTRELSRMIKQAGIKFRHLEDTEADSPLGEYTGAATIFGATGGVMEAALRSAAFLITGNELENPEFKEIQSLEGIKEMEVDVAGNIVRIAVAHGTKNVEDVLNKVRTAKENGEPLPYHFIEVMACPGGCVAGGGQPRALAGNMPRPRGITDDIRRKRSEGLRSEDRDTEIRQSHNNPSVKKLYEEFLSHPLSEKSHKLLHTKYTPRQTYKR
ncbi:MAG: [FeFe] hydrogenase, group A [Alphaproteobacteria bacterium]|nr:[FeFe] hydrogenase, group A [Alphaproteobacteria bacterium]